MRKDRKRADWLAWSLQFIAGSIVGSIVGAVFIPGRRRGFPLVTSEYADSFVIGVALIGAAFASTYGDELWLGSSYRVIPPDAPEHSTASRLASWAAGCIGGFLVLAAIGRSLGVGA